MTQFDVRTTDEGVGVVTPQGRLNMISAGELRERVAELVASGTNRIAVDMAETTFVDSTGLGVLIGCLRSARQAGGDLRVVRPTPAVTRVLELTNLQTLLRPRDTVEGAFGG